MKALIAYYLRSYSVSQRYFGPVAGIIIAVLILYSYKPNPVMNSYAATAVILFVGCAWLGLSFLNHEHPVQKQVVVVQLRSARRYSIGGILTLGLLALLMDLIIVIFPVVTARFNEPPGIERLLLAFAGHAMLGVLGIAVSLYLQSSWVSRTSYAAGLLLVIITLSIGGGTVADLVPGPVVPLLLPPVFPVMNAMMNADEWSLSTVLGTYAHALVYIILLAGYYVFRSGRMDYNKST